MWHLSPKISPSHALFLQNIHLQSLVMMGHGPSGSGAFPRNNLGHTFTHSYPLLVYNWTSWIFLQCFWFWKIRGNQRIHAVFCGTLSRKVSFFQHLQTSCVFSDWFWNFVGGVSMVRDDKGIFHVCSVTLIPQAEKQDMAQGNKSSWGFTGNNYLQYFLRVWIILVHTFLRKKNQEWI